LIWAHCRHGGLGDRGLVAQRLGEGGLDVADRGPRTNEAITSDSRALICQSTTGADLAWTIEVTRPWHRTITVCCAQAISESDTPRPTVIIPR
jgi:hypothetical protein